MTLKYLSPMDSWEEFNRLKGAVHAMDGPNLLLGLSDAQKGHLLSGLFYPLKSKSLIISYSDSRARILYEDLKNLLDDRIHYLPTRDIFFYESQAHSRDIADGRLKVLEFLLSKEPGIIVASIEALSFLLSPIDLFNSSIIELKLGDIIAIDDLLGNLVALGYEREHTVEGRGQFSVRGGIVDIYPVTSDNPIRLEFFGDELDSIRSFDADSQRSLDIVERTIILPAMEIILDSDHMSEGILKIEKDLKRTLKLKSLLEDRKDELSSKIFTFLEDLKEGMGLKLIENYAPYFFSEETSLLDYLNPNTLIILDEMERIRDRYDGWLFEFQENFKNLLLEGQVLPDQGRLIMSRESFFKRLYDFNILVLQSLPRSLPDFYPKAIFNMPSRDPASYQGKLELLSEDLNYWLKRDYTILIMAGNFKKAKALSQNLRDYGFEAPYFEDIEGPAKRGIISILAKGIREGFEYPEGNLLILAEKEIYGTVRHRKTSRRTKKKLDPFTDLKAGDYIVHEVHGIGKYLGIETMVVGGQKRDYLNIKYDGTDKLYIPTDQVEQVQAYIGLENRSPRLSKLGGAEWQRAKARTRESVQKLAMDLVELYASREAIKGFKFSEDSPWQAQFEDAFPYEETEDQIQASHEIKKDMESHRIMDRLLCGDVGYGKTEVALRAAFKAVMDGKQVALLAPTTILAQQHYNTFLERLQDFPMTVDVLSRFKSRAEQLKTLAKLKDGNVDIIIGTHRLLGKDVSFKDLGLLIVDEEQRFGVGHKETIKDLKKDLDVLTLTATPIPRTLHMSLAGIRDISTIETPPEDRIPVQTYVMEYSDSLIRDAILREIQRGGQVYFVYNRVRSMERITEELRDLLPDIRINMAHGQMSERILEQVMLDFYNKEFDLLVCSTIIESGLDIPNVNTIIIYDADNYGLSQLYQLRGRVGRSNRLAYAYLTYKKDKILTEVAEKRLRAIREFTEFGSGFKLAMRDLEIRGSGNILGPEQHGHMTAVGYELYYKMLDDAVREIKGEEREEKLSSTIEIGVNAFIDDSYIVGEGQKIEVYKKIASLRNLEDKMDIIDELLDRFGEIPKALLNLIDIAYIKALAEEVNIIEVVQRDREVHLRLKDRHAIEPKALMVILNENMGKLKLEGVRVPILKILMKNANPSNALEQSMDILERLYQLTRDKSN